MDEIARELSWQTVALEGLRIAGPVGVVVIGMAVIAYFVMRQKGWSAFGNKDRLVPTSRLDAIDGRLGKIEGRLTDVERDLENRPTRQEVKELQLGQVRMEERIKAIDEKVDATLAGNLRIQDFLYQIAGRKS